jgi:hypothetical protein
MEQLSFWFIVAALAVWRMTHLLSREDGPAGLVARLRETLGAGFSASLFGCFYCLSLWVALPFALAFRQSVVDTILLWLGLSGAACLLERFGERGAPLPTFYEGGNKEEHHGLLRGFEPGNHPTDE